MLFKPLFEIFNHFQIKITFLVIVYPIYFLPKAIFFIRLFEVTFPLKHAFFIKINDKRNWKNPGANLGAIFLVQIIFFLDVPDWDEGKTSAMCLNLLEPLPTEMSLCA